MTWREFQLRLFSYNRVQENEWNKVRVLSATIVKSGFLSVENKKKELKNIWSGTKRNKGSLSEKQRLAIIKAQQEYINRNKAK